MREQFPGYYRRTPEELDRIWEDGIFVLDTNVLLNLYRYSQKTREELLGVLRGVQDHLWLPHQVVEEFHKDRMTVIQSQKKAYSAIRESLKKARDDTVKKMGEMHKDPGIVEAKDLRKKIDESFEELMAEAEKFENEAAIRTIGETDSPNDDEIWLTITKIFKGRVGCELPSELKKEICKEEGPERYESRVPPGYKDMNDNSKPGCHKFGDLILWMETIKKARETGKPILLVTDDRKEDWWRISGKTFYAHPELGNEMYREAKVLFHMHLPLDFVKWAAEKLDQEISQEASEEIEELRPLEEDDISSVSEELHGAIATNERAWITPSGTVWANVDMGEILRRADVDKLTGIDMGEILRRADVDKLTRIDMGEILRRIYPQ